MNGGRPDSDGAAAFTRGPTQWAPTGLTPWIPRGLTPWIIVALAAILPYIVTISDYFVRDDFGVVQLLAQKPFSVLSAVVREFLDGRHLGIRAG